MDLSSSKLIRIKIMDYLAIRDHSKKELVKKMVNKVDSIELLQEEINKLESQGYINEERFGEEYIRARILRGYGPIRIKSELRTRGLKDDTISTSLSNYDKAWLSIAIKALNKKFSTGKESNDDFKLLLKKKRFLAYRGFSFEQIDQAIKQQNFNGF